MEVPVIIPVELQEMISVEAVEQHYMQRVVEEVAKTLVEVHLPAQNMVGMVEMEPI